MYCNARCYCVPFVTLITKLYAIADTRTGTLGADQTPKQARLVGTNGHATRNLSFCFENVHIFAMLLRRARANPNRRGRVLIDGIDEIDEEVFAMGSTQPIPNKELDMVFAELDKNGADSHITPQTLPRSK